MAIAPSSTLAALMLLAVSPAAAPMAQADDGAGLDPAGISETDAIECRLDAPDYNGFALSVSGADGIAATRHWRKIEQPNSFIEEYELPAPITVAGTYATRRIAFSASAIVAILDLPDPAEVAAPAQVDNQVDAAMARIAAAAQAAHQAMPAAASRKFLGERVLVDNTDPAKGEEMFGTRTLVARTVSNVSSHPGKTFYGCSYRIEMLDAQGDPL